MTNVGHLGSQRYEKCRAVPLSPASRAYAHLLQQEVVLGSIAFEMSECESHQIVFWSACTCAVYTWGREDVPETLSGVFGPPRFVPRRSVERFYVQGDAGDEIPLREGADHLASVARRQRGRIY